MVPSKKKFSIVIQRCQTHTSPFLYFLPRFEHQILQWRCKTSAIVPKPKWWQCFAATQQRRRRKRMWLKKEFLERVREWLVGWMDQLFYQNGWCPKLLRNDEAKLSATMRLQMSWIMISFCKLVILEGQQSKLADFLSAGAQTMWY